MHFPHSLRWSPSPWLPRNKNYLVNRHQNLKVGYWFSKSHLFIQQILMEFLYVPGPILSTRNTVLYKSPKSSSLWNLYSNSFVDFQSSWLFCNWLWKQIQSSTGTVSTHIVNVQMLAADFPLVTFMERVMFLLYMLRETQKKSRVEVPKHGTVSSNAFLVVGFILWCLQQETCVPNYFQFRLLQLVCTLLGQPREKHVMWQRETSSRFNVAIAGMYGRRYSAYTDREEKQHLPKQWLFLSS